MRRNIADLPTIVRTTNDHGLQSWLEAVLELSELDHTSLCMIVGPIYCYTFSHMFFSFIKNICETHDRSWGSSFQSTIMDFCCGMRVHFLHFLNLVLS